jgi:PAS domain S-box-containing protein
MNPLANSDQSLQEPTTPMDVEGRDSSRIIEELRYRKLQSSEIRYRRLFETARDGILIIDPDTQKITDANPFMTELLGYSHDELSGKELWQLGLPKDEEASRVVIRDLQDRHYIRYEDLPLQGKAGECHQVEFVSNLYQEGDWKVIQCNIRDITERRRAEELVLNASSKEVRRRKKRSLTDMGVILVVSAVTLIVGHLYDVFDPLFLYLATENGKINSDLDEVAATVVVSCFGLLIFAYRRWREGRKEIISQKQIAEALQILHVELERKVLERTAELIRANESLHSEVAERVKAVRQVTLLDTCVANLNDIILITEAAPIEEPGPKIVFVNKAFERITGYTTAEAIGHNPRFLQGEKTDQNILREIHRAIEQQLPIRRQVVNYRKDGSEYLMDIDMVPVFNGDGECTNFIAIEHDITEQKCAEQKLLESERRCREVLENVDLIAISLNQYGLVTFCNDHLLQMTGWTRDELMNSDCFLKLIPETETVLKDLFFDNLASGNFPNHYENAIKTKNGELRKIRWNNTMLRDAAENIIGVTAIGEDVTEQEDRRQQLLWKNAFFEAQVNSSIDGILIVDNDGKKLLQNNRMLELFEIPAEFAHDIDDSRQLQWVTNQIKDPAHFAETVTYLYAHPDEIGRDEIELINGRVFDRYSAPVKGKDGKRYGRIWSFRDVTGRKRTENELIESERKFRKLFDEANDAIFMMHNGVFVDCNAKGLALFGGIRDQIIGQLPSAFAPPTQPDGRDTVEKAAELIQRALGGKPQFFEWVIRRPDSTLVHVDVSLNQLDLGGEIYVQAIARDITSRKRDEDQIAEQAALLDKAQDAIIVRDLKGAIIFWNKGAERIYGWTGEEALGRDIAKFLYANPNKFEEINRLTLSTGEWSGLFTHVTKDHRFLTIEARWTLIRDADGNPKSVLAIYTDVTEKKKMEAQFLRSQRMESIGTLAGGIAHDLNNILAPILMSIDLLKRQSDSPQTTKILQTIQVSAKRGADIVRQVLSFARGMEGQRIEVQPKHLLNDLENIIQSTFPKDIRLRFSVPNDIWTILGDPTQVHQVLLNLSVNARDAMPHGGDLTISVENCVLDEHYAAMHNQAKPGRYVTIKVIDSGTGIPPKLIDKIFEPFFTTKELSKGTGLGLSTVMAIVKSHGGIINVYSSQGKGTAFTVYLPAMEMSAEALTGQSDLADMPRGNGETILVVDDEASILTITGQTLNAYGYVVLIATNGADALASYLQNQGEIKVVLTDMMMPVMDGAALVHALRKINPSVRIIAASGLNAEGEINQATSGGLKHFLIKPYTAGVLLQTMRAILDEP